MHTHRHPPGICKWESEAAEMEGIQNSGSPATAVDSGRRDFVSGLASVSSLLLLWESSCP